MKTLFVSFWKFSFAKVKFKRKNRNNYPKFDKKSDDKSSFSNNEIICHLSLTTNNK